ncbi:MAG: ATP phosphoribosyltransferase, partial [Alphaproteobacteria bacterium]
MDREKRLKIAIQKSGRLADMSLQLLEKSGIQLSKSRDQLLCRSQNFPLDVFLVRAAEITEY